MGGIVDFGSISSASKPIKSPALPLQSIDHIKCIHCLAAVVFGVGHGITDDILQESSHDHPDLIVHIMGDPLDAASPSKSPDCRLGDTEDGIAGLSLVHLKATGSALLAGFSTVGWGHFLFLGFRQSEFTNLKFGNN